MRFGFTLAFWLLLTGAVFAQGMSPPLVFHASFDGTTDAQLVRGKGKPLKVEGPVVFRPGRFGRALLCGEGGATISYASEGVLRATAGTVEMWVCPLDWTGDEDEFHVFLEAPGVGWLAFYRYYQSGIVTLVGTGGATYRAAAGPRFHWTPGQWHHLAGTWRGSALEVYVDGQRVATADYPPIPERFAATFYVGDRPWHVPRKRQTLVDEVKIYAAPLDAASITRAARGEPVQFKPRVVLGVTADPETARLHVVFDAAGAIGGPFGGSKAKIELVSKEKNEPIARADIADFSNDVGRCDLSVDQVPEGDYRLLAVLLDQSGAEVARSLSPFRKPGPSVWSGNRLGMEDKVLPPWTPLKADATSTTVECWGRRYEFGTLLNQARSSGADLLSASVTLEAVTDGKVMCASGPPSRLEPITDTKAVLTGKANGGGLHVAIRHEVEFDGYTWTRLAVDPSQPVRVDELRLAWKMPKSQATLVYSDSFRWTDNPAGQLGPKGWSSPLSVTFWLGNEDRGLCWYTESDRNWRQSPDRPAIQVVPEGDQVKVVVRLIAQPTTVSSRLEYDFGMMATPVRPRPKDARRWRMAPGVHPTLSIIWPNDVMKWYGHPEPKDPKKFAADVKAAHQRGCLVVPYVNLNFVSAGVPEWQYYGSRWADPDRVVTPGDVAEMGHPSMGACPAARDWQDYILYRINEMIDRYEVDGIYIDCWTPSPCKVGPCAWEDEKGTRHRTWPLRSYREILRRAYALCHEKRPNALLMVHMSSSVDIPMLSFTDTILDGEQFGGGKVKHDYLDALSPDKFRAEFLGRNWGPVSFFLPEFAREHAAAGTPDLAAYLMLHDVNAWPLWSDATVWNRLYDALDAVDIGDAEFFPYWHDSGAHAGPQVLVSSYVGKSGAVLAVMNTGEATQATIALDPRRFPLASISAVADFVRNETMKVTGRSIAVPLARHQGRVLVVKP